MSTAPPLPRRPENTIHDEDPGSSEDPPPAYEPTPSHNRQEHTLEYGPARPFQSTPQPTPQSTGYAPPTQPPPSHLPPPNFPFWNGANLTPQQTGFSEGAVAHATVYGAPQQPPFAVQHSTGGSYYSPPPSQQQQPLPHVRHNDSYPAPTSAPPPLPNRTPSHTQPAPLGGPPRPRGYAPTTQPVDGQPLLRDGKLLVYPKNHTCHKCGNTGYKPFGYGRPGDDPNHPCRKDWDKYAKPFAGPLALSVEAPDSIIPPNYQRPLRLPPVPAAAPPLAPPHQRPFGGGGGGGGMMGPPPVMMNAYGLPPPGAIVLRPGDPRMGGRLCYRCGGDGLVTGWMLFDEETCPVCRGAGRTF